MKTRLWTLFGLIFALLAGIAFRIYTLADRHLIAAANEQSTVTVTVANARGTLYDRYGVPLTNTETEYRASVISTAKALSTLSSILDHIAFANMNSRLQSGRPTVVSLPDLVYADGITLFQAPKRYGKTVLASHLIGYMDADQTEGIFGLEAALDSVLNAYSGSATVTYMVDANGRPLGGVFPTINNTLYTTVGGVQLTLDSNIQKTAETIAAKYIKKGAVVVMQPQTGDILAMVSLPNFHPENVIDVLQDENSPLLNRALCSYNCGSVFKIVSAATALENGYTAQQTYTCTGSVNIGGTTFRCHQRLGHGELNMEEAFAKSCNCYFIELMQEVGGDPLWETAERLQFNRSITLTEGIQAKTATLPAKSTLISPAVLANLSFGQGELTATPIHIAQLVSAVANNGKLVNPRIIDGYVDVNGVYTPNTVSQTQQQVFMEHTSKLLQQFMEGVMSDEGTGYAGRPLFSTAAAKTGTAETGWVQAADEQFDVVQSWFAGFYPADDPQYAIVILAENAENTDSKTAPVFKELTEYLYHYPN